MIGKNAGNCLYDQRRYFDKITQLPFDQQKDSNQQDYKDCDVVSIREEATANKSVRDENRIEQLKRKFAQVYMQSAWKDFVFINTLKANTVLSQSNQNKESFELINDSIDDCVDKTNILIVSITILHINYNSFKSSKTHRNNVMLVVLFILTIQKCSLMFITRKKPKELA